MLVTTTNNLFEKQQTFYSEKDALVNFIRQNERGTVQIFEQVNFYNRAFLDIEKINPDGFEESSIFKVADLFTHYVEKFTDIDLKDSSFVVTKNNASLSYHVIFNYALDTITLRSVVALFKALYPWSGIIDDVVYTTGRLFKCVGSYKPGIASTKEDPETYHVVIHPCGTRIPIKDLSDEEIASSLISNMDGAKILSIIDADVVNVGDARMFETKQRMFETRRTLDNTNIQFFSAKLHCRNKNKYFEFPSELAMDVNKFFSIEKIASIETKCSVVKYNEYIDLNNYCTNYNLRLDCTNGLKVYDQNLVEVTEGLDKLLLRCLLSRDITLKVKYDDYIALSGNMKSVTWEDYSNLRIISHLLGREISRGLTTCERAVVEHVRQKLIEHKVPQDLLDYRAGNVVRLYEPKFGDANSLYSLTGIEEKTEFIYLESERYKSLNGTSRSHGFCEYPALYFTGNDYITKPSNTMFKLFVNDKREIKKHRTSSYVNPYARGPQAEISDNEDDDHEDGDDNIVVVNE